MGKKKRICNFCGKDLNLDNYVNIRVEERDTTKSHTTTGQYRSMKLCKKPCWMNLKGMFNGMDYREVEELEE